MQEGGIKRVMNKDPPKRERGLYHPPAMTLTLVKYLGQECQSFPIKWWQWGSEVRRKPFGQSPVVQTNVLNKKERTGVTCNRNGAYGSKNHQCPFARLLKPHQALTRHQDLPLHKDENEEEEESTYKGRRQVNITKHGYG